MTIKKRRRKNFEIKFYENLLKQRPDFVHVLFCLGDEYTRKGFYKEGLAVDRRLAKLKPNDPIVHYNLACSLSLIKDIEGALKSFKKAVFLGYSDYEYMGKDPDLENLRKDVRFQEFFSKLEKLKTSSIEGVVDGK